MSQIRKLLILLTFLSFNHIAQSQNILTNTVYNLKEGNILKAKGFIDIAREDTLFNEKAGTWYYSGYVYKELYKTEESFDRKDANRTTSIQHFLKSIELEPDGSFSKSSKKNIEYLAATLYNDGVNSISLNLFDRAKDCYKRYKDVIINVNDSIDFLQRDIEFNSAIASAYAKVALTDENKKIKYIEKAKETFNKVLELDEENTFAKYNLAAIEYNDLLIEFDKEKEKRLLDSLNLKISNAKLEKSTQKIDSIRREFILEEIALDSIKHSLEVLEVSIAEKNNDLLKTQNELNEQMANLNIAKDELKESKENLNTTLTLLENQKTINIIIALVGTIILVLLFLAIRGFVKQRKQTEIIEKNRNEIHQQHLQLSEKNKEITDSIAYAKRIQTAILPPKKLVKEYLTNSFILYKPKDVVAGDFYWMETFDDLVLYAAADCTGHGVPGAMVSVVCVNGLNRAVREFGLRNPAKILETTRELVIKEFDNSEDEVKDGMDISLCALNTKTNELLWAGAHNPLWIVKKDANAISEIKADKQPIGKFELSIPFTSHSIQLEKGDTIYTFSDGFPDQFGGEKGKKYKSGKFKNTIIQLSRHDIEKQHDILNEEFENWKGTLEQLDDVCVIGVRV